jgi:hypothetical protein
LRVVGPGANCLVGEALFAVRREMEDRHWWFRGARHAHLRDRPWIAPVISGADQ